MHRAFASPEALSDLAPGEALLAQLACALEL
jgi:hypothetical protein